MYSNGELCDGSAVMPADIADPKEMDSVERSRKAAISGESSVEPHVDIVDRNLVLDRHPNQSWAVAYVRKYGRRRNHLLNLHSDLFLICELVMQLMFYLYRCVVFVRHSFFHVS